MRTYTTIGTILVLLLAGSLLSYQYLQGTTNTLGSQITQIEQSISGQKWDDARQELKQTQEKWEKTKTWWTVLLNHQDIDSIDFSLNRLEKYLDTQNLSLSLGEASALELMFKQISEVEKPTLKNIL